MWIPYKFLKSPGGEVDGWFFVEATKTNRRIALLGIAIGDCMRDD